ncbi:unnamed protein product [Cylindrotheca closterium]|uniref:Uncharacterized protein n=1 Tax=Cylindrotheca closterium TaxID=2856 RepID=A0AAD2FEZ6_9STRA|nr:unnamed protein product [Cylindrotheca closterium]
MPQGKKNKAGRGRNNKKKRGAGHGKNSHLRTNNGRKEQVATISNLPENRMPSLTFENSLERDAPDYQSFQLKQGALHETFPTVYTRYKAATDRFLKYMQDNSPESIHGNRMNVNSLITATDWMEETNRPVEPSIVKDLELVIRVRSRVTEQSLFGRADMCHQHLLKTSVYCWRVLASLPQASVTTSLEKEINENLTLSGVDVSASRTRFEALQDSDEEAEMAEEELFPSKPVARPDPQPEPLSLEETLKSDARHDSWLFLYSMDELMRIVPLQYTAVRRQAVAQKQRGSQDTSIVEILMEAAVATNMAIQQMQQLEMEFELHHPDMVTPYQLLATFAFPGSLVKTREIVRDHGQKPCSEKEARLFLSECLEHNFRPPSDPERKCSVLVSEFCQRYQINNAGTEQIQAIYRRGFESFVSLEVPISRDRTNNKWLFEKLKKHDPNFSSHSWIPRDMENIGGDRAIHHTIRLLQFFGAIVSQIEEDGGIAITPGFFGPKWEPSRSGKIHEDMDDLLMSEILPKWFLLSRDGILGKTDLPRQNELATFWTCMKEYFNAPTNPVRWSIAFAVHAMLTAIIETDGVIDDTMISSQISFESFFAQLDRATQMKKMEAKNLKTPLFKHNMAIGKYLRNFGRPLYGNRSMWNPLCGGTLLTYVAFFGNLEVGCTLIDERSQLRMVLHLYHALVVNKMLKRGEAPLVDTLFDIFQKSQAIWGGTRPTKGRFVKEFWLSMGADTSFAAKMSSEACEFIQKVSSNRADHPVCEDLASMDTLSIPPIEPSEICTSFRRICNRDFHDVVDNYHTPEQRRIGVGSDSYTLAVQTNDTLDAIDNEQQTLALNLSSVGTYLEQFIFELSAVFKWDPILDRSSQEPSDFGLGRRRVVVHMFAQNLLGALDYATDPMELKICEVPQGRTAHAMMTKLLRIPPREVTWFQATGEVTEVITDRTNI